MKFKDIMLVILVLLVVFMGSYLGYDKFFNDKNNTDGKVIGNVNNALLNDVTKLEGYKNYDGSYGNVETLIYDVYENSGEYYSISLDLSGNVNYYHTDGDERQEKVLLENVIDIISYNDGAGGAEVSYCYMLDKDGNVYKFKVTDKVDKDLPVERVEISNVSKLLNVSWASQENAGGSWAIVAVTYEGEYIELARASV